VTAEIAVMNEEAVALAADSAVSGPTKVFTSANKIFALSKHHPVAIMVNDSARFLGVPWETIIKSYRSQLGERSFRTVREHAANFLGFFDQPNPLFPAAAQVVCNEKLFARFFEAIFATITSKLEQRIDKGESLTRRKIELQVSAVVLEFHRILVDEPNTPSLPHDHSLRVATAYQGAIQRAIENTFQKLPVSAKAREHLQEIAGALASIRRPNPLCPWHSGLVIAGFGSDEHFPSLYSFDLDTIALNRLKYSEGPPTRIGPEGTPAVVRAFAQHEQVATFMEGLDGTTAEAITAYWRVRLPVLVAEVADKAGFDDAAKQKLSADMQEWCETTVSIFDDVLKERRRSVYGPIIRVVAMMPKDELAAMAESLVNLTSFKRKVTEEAETVGGPIDVAVISKGDGLIWVKRKHYFKPELNQQFFANYYRRGR
jgi:hypothetical protein